MAHSKHGEVVRIEIEYEDGTLRRLEGEDAELWGSSVDRVLAVGLSHGIRVPNADWEYLEREE